MRGPNGRSLARESCLTMRSDVKERRADLDLDFDTADRPLEPDYARQLACGEIDPISKLPMVDINPDAFLASQVSSLPLSLSLFALGDTDLRSLVLRTGLLPRPLQTPHRAQHHHLLQQESPLHLHPNAHQGHPPQLLLQSLAYDLVAQPQTPYWPFFFFLQTRGADHPTDEEYGREGTDQCSDG